MVFFLKHTLHIIDLLFKQRVLQLFLSLFQPYLVRYLVSVLVHKKPDAESLNRLQQLLKFLNAELKSKSLTKVIIVMIIVFFLGSPPVTLYRDLNILKTFLKLYTNCSLLLWYYVSVFVKWSDQGLCSRFCSLGIPLPCVQRCSRN